LKKCKRTISHSNFERGIFEFFVPAPIDLIEISDESGSIRKVKVLGTLCLIDEGEVDWKVICTNVDFAKKRNIRNVVDLENLFPHRINAAKQWFKYLKTYDGKKANRLFFNEDVLGVDKSLQIIDENYEYWKEL